MAKRRMMSLLVVDSDAFMDMPLTTQALYMHLLLRADDDGFINNVKRILRATGASEDDLKILLAKRYLIPFDNGVVVIRHWRIHNYIQSDRYTPTSYQEELSQLEVNANKEYVENIGVEGQCIQNGYILDTQVRLGKDRLGKVRLGKGSIGEHEGENPHSEEPQKSENAEIIGKVVDIYNETCHSFPKVKHLSEKRKKAIKARLNSYSLADLKEAFAKCEQSDFLKGNNNRNWIPNFDWIIADSNIAKILDGNYDNRKKTRSENVMNEWKDVYEWAKGVQNDT